MHCKHAQRACRSEPSFVFRQLGEEGSKGGVCNGCDGSSGRHRLRGPLCILPLESKTTVLGIVDAPGHVMLAPVLGLLLDYLLFGLTFLGGYPLPGLFLLLILLVESVLLVLLLLVVVSSSGGPLVILVLVLLSFLFFFFFSKLGASLSLPFRFAIIEMSFSLSRDLAPQI